MQSRWVSQRGMSGGVNPLPGAQKRIISTVLVESRLASG